MEKYIIVDWANNLIFGKKIFNSLEDAEYFKELNVLDEDIEDTFIIEVNDDTRIRNMIDLSLSCINEKYILVS